MTKFVAKKRFGQNFLQDENIIKSIVKKINIQDNDFLLEIGPGLGALTLEVLNYIKINKKSNVKFIAIEADRTVIPILQNKCTNLGNLNIYEGDILKVDLNNIFKDNKNIKIFGNLPYNISSPVLFHLLNYTKNIQEMIFMFQKEVVDRIIASPNNKNYGRLAINVQYFCKTEYILNVPPESFSPKPKVNSSVVKISPYKNIPFIAYNFELFKKIVKMSFAQRRKTLLNNLKKYVSLEDFNKANINPSKRAENILLEDFVNLTNIINNK